MVASAMQFLRICQAKDFDNVVVSMKSSNTRVMIQSVRLLADALSKENMRFPIHLGVTEAGDAEQGRIKSAVGMAPLLLDGLGDTLRVSLTEDPENELPVASQIRSLFPKPAVPKPPTKEWAWDPFEFQRRRSNAFHSMGRARAVVIISSEPPDPEIDLSPTVLEGAVDYRNWSPDLPVPSPEVPLVLEKEGHSLSEIRDRLNTFCFYNRQNPVVYRTRSTEEDPVRYMLSLAGELGFLLVDGAVDAVYVENPSFDHSFLNRILLLILQAARARISQVEYIACPSCGRTHFDIQQRLREIREVTGHLDPVRIGVMGCFVNGPGEMADADYGYVGAGPGKVDLYRGKEVVLKNVPEEKALDDLMALLRKDGRWKDPGT
jgi:(E)-4-hydroxy-3-methylbut-2-enyl-diphosphate synthase